MITQHQYLDQYPIAPESKKLIVGTIHPHDHEQFLIPFFYGNVNSIWLLLSQAFPHDLPLPLTLEKILRFLNERKIAVSDTIRTCRRTTSTALDKDLVPLELNEALPDAIRNSNIEEILFTSGFQKNSAFRLFYTQLLGYKITDQIRKDRMVQLSPSVFGRPVQLTVLYSPSGASNVGIARSRLFLANKEKYKDSKRPVYDFKIDYYRHFFKT